jgi:TRAP transporter TAXI family solute receptor
MKIRILAIFAAVAALFGVSVAQAQTVGFATLPPGAINNITVQVIAKVAQQHTNLKMRVQPFRGTHAMQTAVNNGQADLGITEVASMTASLQGIAEFKGRPLNNLRVVFRIRTLSVGMFVRKDSPIKTIADIKGKRYPSQWSAFPNAIPLTMGIFATEGMSFDDVDGVPTTNIIRAADDFKAGKLDVGFFAVGAPKMAEVNSAVGGIRFLSIDNTPEKLAKMQTIRPDYFINTVKPSPINAGIAQPTNVLGVDVLIDAGAHVKDEVIQEFLAGIYPNKADLVKGHPLFRAFVPELMSRQYKVARYHPGAIKFYKEKGLWK